MVAHLPANHPLILVGAREGRLTSCETAKRREVFLPAFLFHLPLEAAAIRWPG
jgi:hypothetical protein